jgi:DNA-binding LacI/PurR family transcriptional regulator
MSTAKKRPAATQRDIARLARVSQSTVSRVLTGDNSVEPETAQRVRSAIAEANYRPDIAARSLRSRKSGLIGLVVKRPAGGLNEDPFFANLTSEIIDRLSGTPYKLCLEQTTETDQVAVYDDLLRTRRVDGLILVESEARDNRINRLQADRFPFVLIGNPSMITNTSGDHGVWSVDNDNVAAANVATDHLIEEGFQNIGFLAGPEGVTVSQDRAQGFRRALDAHGLCGPIWHCEFGLERARAAAANLLSSPSRPEALLVLDDLLAMGVVLAARDLGIAIPQDLALVSFNNSSLCEVLDSGLTSVNLNIHEIVREACYLLLKLIDGTIDIAAPHRKIVPTTLTVRGSSLRNTRGHKNTSLTAISTSRIEAEKAVVL